MNSKTVSRIGILGVLLFAASCILGGYSIEGYDSLRKFISETYAIDTTYGIYLRMFGIIPSGVLFTLFFFYAKNTFLSIKSLQLGFMDLSFSMVYQP